MNAAPADAAADRHRPDEARLAQWIGEQVAPVHGRLSIAKFGDGQSNPTYRIDDGRASYVLRRKPLGPLLPSAHQVEREFRVMRALQGSGVPVPVCHALCEDPEVIGSTFFLMEFVAGRHFPDTLMPGVAATERRQLFEAMADTLGRLHAVDPAAVGLADFGRPGNYFSRQIERWSRQYRASEIEPIESMHHLMETLPGCIPAGEEMRLIHGDFRADNMIFDATKPRVAALLDWELSTLGDPLGDLGYHVAIWRLPRSVYHYGIADADFALLGIPDERAHLAAYHRLSGRPERAGWEFSIVFNLFRLAAILQGIAARAAAGIASNARAAQAGVRARAIADLAWAACRRLDRTA